MATRTTTQFAIIGAGAGGLCAGIKLRESGRADFLIFDRNAEVGGTWYRNTYPGAACDIASHLYCYSFAPNPGVDPKPYATQPEIQAYLKKVSPLTPTGSSRICASGPAWRPRNGTKAAHAGSCVSRTEVRSRPST